MLGLANKERNEPWCLHFTSISVLSAVRADGGCTDGSCCERASPRGLALEHSPGLGPNHRPNQTLLPGLQTQLGKPDAQRSESDQSSSFGFGG